MFTLKSESVKCSSPRFTYRPIKSGVSRVSLSSYSHGYFVKLLEKNYCNFLTKQYSFCALSSEQVNCTIFTKRNQLLRCANDPPVKRSHLN